MDLQALLLIGLVCLIASAAIDLLDRWWLRRSTQRLIARMESGWKDAEVKQPRLLPESRYTVRLFDTGVSCTHPDGEIEKVEWADLQRVEIVTTDHGPFLPDVFWVLHGSQMGCVVPQGATGEDDLLDRLQKLPGFRNEAVIEAMPSTENHRFLCWEKARAGET